MALQHGKRYIQTILTDTRTLIVETAVNAIDGVQDAVMESKSRRIIFAYDAEKIPMT